MERRSRTKAIYINSIVTMMAQILQVIVGFIVRKVFINSLGVSYLGYNSVFQNILQMLNLADMGIGVAITSFLYKPLAEHDMKRTAALMAMYKKVYNLIGLVVLILGIVVSFFLSILIPDASDSLWYLRVLFYINLLGTVSTYYLAYKRTLFIADQKSYLTSAVDTIMFFVFSGLQLLVLFQKPNYIAYLVLGICKNIISNVIISVRCDHQYGRIDKRYDKKIYTEYKPKVINYVKDVFVSRIGAYVYYSTDNIIISSFRGSILTGFYSNYTMVTLQVQTLFNLILSSIQATFGNYISTVEDKKKQQEMTDNYLCADYYLGNFCMLCIMFLIQPFIQIVFGKRFVLSFSTAFWLSVNLMLTLILTLPSQVFTIYKLYHYDRPIIAVSAILNIVISIALVIPLGIDGALIGTFVTSLIYLYSRMFIISKRVYEIPYRHYLAMLLKYWCVSAVSIAAIYFCTKSIPGTSFASFIVRMIIVGLLSLLIPAVCLMRSKEFEFLRSKLIPQRFQKFVTNKILAAGCVGLVVVSLIIGGRL